MIITPIPEHIKNLLFEQDCVVIPEFGGFIANLRSAALHANGSVLPPRRSVMFNEVLKFDDGLLSTYVAFMECCSRSESLQHIKSFSEHLKTELRRRNHYRFENMGSFTLNQEGKLQFEPDDRTNFRSESYGCVPIFPNFFRRYENDLRLITIEQSKQTHEKIISQFILEPEVEEIPVRERELNSERSRRGDWIPAAAACVAIVLSLAGLKVFNSQPSSLSSLNPFVGNDFTWMEVASMPAKQIISSKETPLLNQLIPDSRANTPNPIVKNKTDVYRNVSKTMNLAILSNEADVKIKIHEKRFYVIVGGFKKEVTAKKMKRQLLVNGYEYSSIVRPRVKGLVKVSVGNYESFEEAASMARQMGTRFGDAAWVLKQ